MFNTKEKKEKISNSIQFHWYNRVSNRSTFRIRQNVWNRHVKWRSIINLWTCFCTISHIYDTDLYVIIKYNVIVHLKKKDGLLLIVFISFGLKLNLNVDSHTWAHEICIQLIETAFNEHIMYMMMMVAYSK